MIIIWMFLWAVYIGTCIWVFNDAKKRIAEGNKLEPIKSTGGWLAGCILLWILFFPWYLVSKGTLKSTLTGVVGQVTEPLNANRKMPESIADELLKFNELKEKGVISEADFEAQRERLLGTTSKTSQSTQTAQTQNSSPKTGVVTCKTCNAELSAQVAFCGDCGSKVEGAKGNV